MFRLLRRLVNVGGSARTVRPLRPAAATSDVLARGPMRPASPRPKSAADGGIDFDPYNTGAFDRSSSWERIGKRDY